MEWESRINGKQLRKIIQDQDGFESVIKELHNLVANILNRKNVYYRNDFEELFEHLKNDLEYGEEYLLDYIESEMPYQSIVGYLDEKLDWFYDLCDKERIWITV